MPTPRWGDDVDDSDEEAEAVVKRSGEVTIPPTHKSRVDSQGIAIITSYRQNPSNKAQLIKTVTKVKVSTEKVREAKAVGERRLWSKFGQAARDEKAGTKTTVQSKDEILMEDPNADTDLQEEDVTQAISGNLNAFWAKQQRRQLERKYDIGSAPAEEETGVGRRWVWEEEQHLPSTFLLRPERVR